MQWEGESPILMRGVAEAIALVAAQGLEPVELDTLRIAGEAVAQAEGEPGRPGVYRELTMTWQALDLMVPAMVPMQPARPVKDDVRLPPVLNRAAWMSRVIWPGMP